MTNDEVKTNDLIDPEFAVYGEDGSIIGQTGENGEVTYLEGKEPKTEDPKPEESNDPEKKPNEDPSKGEPGTDPAKGDKGAEGSGEEEEYLNYTDYILKMGGYDRDEIEFENGEVVKIADLTPDQQLNIVTNEFNRMREEFQTELESATKDKIELNDDQKALVDFLNNGGTAKELAQYILDNDPDNAHKTLTDDDLVLESLRKSMPGADDEDIQEEFKILKEAGRVEKRAQYLRKQLASGEIKFSDISTKHSERLEAARQAELETERQQLNELTTIAKDIKEIAGIPVDSTVIKGVLKELVPEELGTDSNFLKSLNDPKKMIRMQFLDKYAEKVLEHVSNSAMAEGVRLERERLQDRITELESQLNLKNQHLQKFSQQPLIKFSKENSKNSPQSKTKTEEEVF